MRKDPAQSKLSLVRAVVLLCVAMGLPVGVGALVYDARLGYAALGAVVPLFPLLYLNVRAHRAYTEQLESKTRHAENMAQLNESTLRTFVLAIDAKDQHQGHAIRVQAYARALARAMKMDDDEVDGIAAAALLHDIGKLAVPDYILRKKGSLTPEEMAKMRLHPQVGADIISNIKFPYPVSEAVRCHHERYDGSGYPAGLRRESIPVAARLVAIVDSYESFMSRHGNFAVTADQAMAMLENGAGSIFDPDIVAHWKRIHLNVTGEVSREDNPDYRPNAYSDIERAASEVHVLGTLSEAISGSSSVQEIALEATRMLENLIPSSKAVLWSVYGDQLVSHFENEEEVTVLQFGAGVSGWVAAEQSPCVNLIVDAGRYEGARVVSAPVVFDGSVLAVLSVYREAVFGDDDVRRVTATAERIAGGLHKTRMIEVAYQDAISDRLTGLANRRALERAFKDYPGESFSIVLFDLDSFKAVNDRFGHRAGDDVLVRLASHLKSVFPSTDITCRLGGDEFLVASEGSAFEVRRAVRELQRLVKEDSEFEPYRELGFGVSWGIATAPEDGCTLSDVTAVADRRMYRLKSQLKKNPQDRSASAR